MHQYRLNRLFNASSGRALDVAVDHGFFGEPAFLTGITDMRAAVETLVSAGPDAIQLTPGQAGLLQSVPGKHKPALVLRVDVANVYGNPLDTYLFSRHFPDAVEQAVKLDAVCVVVNLLQLPGRPDIRERCIDSIMQVRQRCSDYGMPLMVEPLVMQDNASGGGGYMVDGDTVKIVALVRQARELGADLIKADPTTQVEDYHRVVEAAGDLPLLVRGGGKVPDLELLERTVAVLEQGARGIVYGRNIIQHADPAGITAALMAILHQKASAEQALELVGEYAMTGARSRANIAIIGGGLMGREIAAAIQRWPALVDHPVNPRLIGVADINPEALDWFKSIDSVKTLVTDYRDLLSDPDVDVVYVAVRHDLHEQIYNDTISAGKDLLAEKPFGIDTAAGERIMEVLAAHPDVFVRVSSEMPFFPGAQAAIGFIESGALGRIIEARSAFLHSSDLDAMKAINWKRQAAYCGAAGVLNDLGMHAWHVPLRLAWVPSSVYALLSDIVTERPDAHGVMQQCDTWENATVMGRVGASPSFPLTVETKRIALGHKNTWELEVFGTSGGVRYSTKYPKTLHVMTTAHDPSLGALKAEQRWQQVDVGSQSVWPSVTGGIFETGFSDAILQMWAAFLAERAGALGGRFGTARPDEALLVHRINAAALTSNATATTATV